MKYPMVLSSVILFSAGVGIPLMAAINAGLGQRIGSPAVAVFILSCVAAMVSGALLCVGTLPEMRSITSAPIGYYFGGVFFILYIFSITALAPKFGLGNAIFFVLLGQLFSAVAIDHFGLFGLPVNTISIKRAIGLLLMGLGVYLVVKK